MTHREASCVSLAGCRARQSRRVGNPDHVGGFTLIDILLVVAVIGILASIAVPRYQSYVARSLRVDAHAGLHIAAGELERCHTRQYHYADCAITAASPDRSYAIDYTEDADAGFIITAKTARDDGCDADLTLDGLGRREPADCW